MFLSRRKRPQPRDREAWLALSVNLGTSVTTPERTSGTLGRRSELQSQAYACPMDYLISTLLVSRITTQGIMTVSGGIFQFIIVFIGIRYDTAETFIWTSLSFTPSPLFNIHCSLLKPQCIHSHQVLSL